jgi:branched-subunit amino acid transport protein
MQNILRNAHGPRMGMECGVLAERPARQWVRKRTPRVNPVPALLHPRRNGDAPMIPAWLDYLSVAYLALGLIAAIIIAVDLLRHPQHMWIMNVVWPVTALFGTVWIVWQYFTYGRLASRMQAHQAKERHEEPPNKTQTPFPVMVANGALHCGSGCTLGDICAEWLSFAAPAVAVAFGWHSLFGDKIFAVWIVDYIFAYIFGIVFQYFTIAPMRGLSFGQGIVAAIKADTLSLTAWQVGMYGFMAIAYFGIFQHGLGVKLKTDTVEFWFMMQIAMLCGFATAYPVNWWLIRSGLKEKM